jgi:acetyl-CoA carboxylase biotin carboxyl carrier protein
MTVDEIRELINLATETGIAELEVQRGDNRVRIRRSMGGHQEFVWAPQVAQGRTEAPAPAAAVSSGAPPPAREEPKEPGSDPNLTLVRSPIVGTFYEGSGPGSPAFVQVGEQVKPGKVLCIIESMKLMNEIEAEVSGTIESKLVANGQPVEYGEGLFAIRPN